MTDTSFMKSCDLQTCVQKSRRASKLPANALLAEFSCSLSRDRGTTVDLLIQMGAIESRALYAPLACGSMYAYCTQVLHMSEGTAFKRIRAARAARKFPAILPLVAEGKLHLSAVALPAPHLTRDNVDALLAEATHKSKAEVERLIALRFPKADVETLVRPLWAQNAAIAPVAQVIANMASQLSPGTVVPSLSGERTDLVGPLCVDADTHAVHEVVSRVVTTAAKDSCPEPASEALLHAITHAVAETLVKAASPPPERIAKVTPRSPGRFAWQLTADQEMQDLLEQAQDLVGHAGPKDLPNIIKRALTLLVGALRKSKRVEAGREGTQRALGTGRHMPRAMVRAVRARDADQCTFTTADGRRCLELPIGRAGEPGRACSS